jgi:hypothetical protein
MEFVMKMKADAVIVGTGVGGLFSALNLPRDKKIIMITKSDLESSDSFLAQGGICMLHDEDDYDSYFEDTMKAGHYENRKESVDISEDFIDTIQNKTWLNDQILPYELYLKLIYEYLEEDINLADEFEPFLPDGFMKLKYQNQAAIQAKKVLETRFGYYSSNCTRKLCFSRRNDDWNRFSYGQRRGIRNVSHRCRWSRCCRCDVRNVLGIKVP